MIGGLTLASRERPEWVLDGSILLLEETLLRGQRGGAAIPPAVGRVPGWSVKVWRSLLPAFGLGAAALSGRRGSSWSFARAGWETTRGGSVSCSRAGIPLRSGVFVGAHLAAARKCYKICGGEGEWVGG